MSSNMLVIAHRGASGYLPEHTREAKVLAYGQGADFLEQDVVATRDGVLVVLHDIFLDDVSDVAIRYPGRCRSDGLHYVIDFDFAELRQLSLSERRHPATDQRLRPGRFADSSIEFRIVTFAEEIRLIKELNRISGREVGLYPEIKRPDWHRQHDFDLSVALLECLWDHGYRDHDANVFVQCFDALELRRCREALGTTLRLVQLMDRTDSAAIAASATAVQGGSLSAAAQGGSWSVGSLAEIGEYADVVAPHYSLLLEPLAASIEGSVIDADRIARDAAANGLALHCYTLRRDAPTAGSRSFEELVAFLFVEARANALFCDHPDAAVRVRDRLRSLTM